MRPKGRFFAIPARRGKPGGVGPALTTTCRWRCCEAGARRPASRISPGSHRQRLGRRGASSASSSGSRRPFQATSRPAVAQQRRGELGQRRQPPDRARGDHVVGLAPPSGGRRPTPPSAARDRAGVVEAGGLDRALDELGLAPDGLDQVDLRLGQRRGEHQAREAGAGADVGEPLAACRPARGR